MYFNRILVHRKYQRVITRFKAIKYEYLKHKKPSNCEAAFVCNYQHQLIY